MAGTALAFVALIAAVFLFAWWRDSSQKEHGLEQVDTWSEIEPQDRGYARWIAENGHDKAANWAALEKGGLTKRSRAGARFKVSNEHYAEVLRDLVVSNLDNAGLRNNYAWQLVEKNPGRRDKAAEAVRHARRAVELAPTTTDRAEYLDTLAFALHAAGETAEALTTQRKALELLPREPANAKLRGEFEERLRRYGG